MTIADNNDIRRRPDGSIDTGYYMRRGRTCRAQQAKTLAQALLTVEPHTPLRDWFLRMVSVFHLPVR